MAEAVADIHHTDVQREPQPGHPSDEFLNFADQMLQIQKDGQVVRPTTPTDTCIMEEGDWQSTLDTLDAELDRTYDDPVPDPVNVGSFGEEGDYFSFVEASAAAAEHPTIVGSLRPPVNRPIPHVIEEAVYDERPGTLTGMAAANVEPRFDAESGNGPFLHLDEPRDKSQRP